MLAIPIPLARPAVSSTMVHESASATQISVLPVVMAGGGGTRLWPLSRQQYPKQFLCLAGKESLLQSAVRRGMALAAADRDVAAPALIGNEAHRFMLQEQLREMGLKDARIVLEPAARNTAPAVTMAALLAREGGADPVMVVMPADHVMEDEAAFSAAVHAATAAAAEADGAIVILGIPANRPETGYGYIRVAPGVSTGAMTVSAFVEKPDVQTATRYVADGGYFWNSGVFVLRASTWLAALSHWEPEMAAHGQAAWDARTQDGVFVRPDAACFEHMPANSVDFAVMERLVGSAWRLLMLPLDAGWSDLGAWESVWQVAPKDDRGNVTRGDVMLHASNNVLVHATDRLVSVIGLDDVVVVETPDAVMVASRAASQQVKQVVDALSQAGRTEQSNHRQVYRPWGSYDSIDRGARFQVKRIVVKPGASLSLQMHHHRAEHWIVVSGTAEITNGDKVLLLSENQSTYIPLGHVHRLSNPGKVPLELIEVQSGSYLGEDDIVRLEDVYGRG